MEEILKILERKGEIKRKEIYGLLKTNSHQINFEISKKIKSFNKIDDFFNHYSNQTSLFELLNKVELHSSKDYDKLFSTFESNIEQYISCFSQLIISIKLILKTQEILNKIYLSSKQYLSKLKIENQIENIFQENLFFFIENLLDFSLIKKSWSFSNASTTLNFDSCDSINNNLSYNQKFINEQDFKFFSNDDFGETLKIINEESDTPKFGLKLDKSSDNFTKKNPQNIHIQKDSSFSFSDEKQINSLKASKVTDKDKRNNSIAKKVKYYNISNEQKYENLLEMINDIYRKGIVNSQEKIRLKQLVIAKSKKLESLYYNIYKKKLFDQNILRSEITKLLNLNHI